MRIHHYVILLMISGFAVPISAADSVVSSSKTEGGIKFNPFLWASEPPDDCPFPQSSEFAGVYFEGVCSDYRVADTWYPSWADDGNLYSPFTDGGLNGLDCTSDGGDQRNRLDATTPVGSVTHTGQAVMHGNDPLNLELRNTSGLQTASALPYMGRYPCGSLLHKDIWYYGTYCLDPKSSIEREGWIYNWPVLGPMPGFRISKDYGVTWSESPHTPEKPLFPEPSKFMGTVKMGAPHFVDFGRDMEHSPDGKAYLLGQGADENDPQPRIANLSWITADQVYLSRVTPSVENINDISKYEFFAGHTEDGNPRWSSNFADIRPLLEWNNHMGCVTATWDPSVQRYLMCVTDGRKTSGKMSSYILESKTITGPWKMVAYLKDFGEQGYFLNIPSKFIAKDGRGMWLCYSANFYSPPGENVQPNPPGSNYGLVLQRIRLVTPGEKADMKK